MFQWDEGVGRLLTVKRLPHLFTAGTAANLVRPVITSWLYHTTGPTIR